VASRVGEQGAVKERIGGVAVIAAEHEQLAGYRENCVAGGSGG
jgi:hypothetical protein